MSGILAVIGSVRDSRVEAALAPLRYLGGEREQLWSEEDALIVVTRKAWQLEDDFSGNVLVLETPDLVVAADASLFDKKGLARKLSTAGVRAHGETASHYLEAAYRAWGPEMVHQLNGDYAFVIWDRRERKLFAARDPIGGRPFYWTRIGSGIAVASSCRTLAELRGTADDLNLTNLGGLVAGLAWSHGMDTAYDGVDTILPGRSITWDDGTTTLVTWWHPRAAPDRRPSPVDEAAEELRELLRTSVSQRLASGTTTVWMSGGWDSTAVFAAGQDALAQEGRSRLRPVSISYPEGDPGNEDAFIREVASHWKAKVHWVQSADLQMFEHLAERAAQYDEPPAHIYELWNRGLAQATRAEGARVTLDGSGGDQLFQVSDVILADLLRAGRLLKLAEEGGLRKGAGWRHLARAGVLPLLPPSVVRFGERVLGHRLPRHYLERPPMPWIDPEFMSDQRLRERDLDVLGAIRGHSIGHTETLLYLTLPIWGWGGSFMRGPLAQEGVEVRFPLLDLRVVEFALRRPVAERATGLETKLLLRRAMKGLLPETVLAPRPHRTGMTIGFSRRHMRTSYPAMFDRLFAEPLRLAALGVVNTEKLHAASQRFLSGWCSELIRVNLFHTMKTEFWLRGIERREVREFAHLSASQSQVDLPAA